jgi:hypothetical protein
VRSAIVYDTDILVHVWAEEGGLKKTAFTDLNSLRSCLVVFFR